MFKYIYKKIMEHPCPLINLITKKEMVKYTTLTVNSDELTVLNHEEINKWLINKRETTYFHSKSGYVFNKNLIAIGTIENDLYYSFY